VRNSDLDGGRKRVARKQNEGRGPHFFRSMQGRIANRSFSIGSILPCGMDPTETGLPNFATSPTPHSDPELPLHPSIRRERSIPHQVNYPHRLLYQSNVPPRWHVEPEFMLSPSIQIWIIPHQTFGYSIRATNGYYITVTTWLSYPPTALAREVRLDGNGRHGDANSANVMEASLLTNGTNPLKSTMQIPYFH
jgi:hypothetical protein